MSRETLITDYVRTVLDARDDGREADLADVCREHPELITVVREILDLEASMAADELPDPLIGATLDDRYTLRERIGSGAMGAVYEAFDESLERVAAVKVLQSGVLLAAQRGERFVREARVLAGLDHDHIVRIFDHGLTVHGLHYLVMERLQGVSLAQVLERLPEATPDAIDEWFEREFGIETGHSGLLPLAAAWGAQLASALATSHDAGVLHRDVKPSNVFITTEGRAVLLDFGIAQRADDTPLTLGSTTLGSPWYMAPEPAERGVDLTPAIDVYGLCATLYHVVTRRPPYQGDYADVIAQLRVVDPAPPHSLRAELPRDLCAILEHGMERVASARYATARDLEADLLAFRDHRPITARPLTRLERTWRKLKRHRARVVGVAVVLIAIGLAAQLAVSTERSAHAREALRRSEAEEYRRLHASLPPMLGFEGYPADYDVRHMDEQNGALPALDRMLVIEPQDRAARLARAAIWLDRGEFDACLEDLEASFRDRESPYATAVLDRFRAADRSSRGARAVDLDNLPDPGPGFDSYVAGFLLLRRRGDLGQAIELLDRAGEYTPAHELRLIPLMLGGGGPSERARATRETALRSAQRHVDRLGYPTARTEHVIGTVHLNAKRYAAAIRPLELARRLATPSHNTLHNLGEGYRRTARLREALECFEASSALRPWAWKSQQQMAAVLTELGEFEAAVAWAESLRASPGPVDYSSTLLGYIHLQWARQHRFDGDAEAAAESARTARAWLEQSPRRDAFVKLLLELSTLPERGPADATATIRVLRLLRQDAANPALFEPVIAMLPDDSDLDRALKLWLRQLYLDLSPSHR